MRRFTRVAAGITGAWTLVGILTTQLAFLAIERSGGHASWGALLSKNLVSVWLWAAFTPAMIWMSNRFPLGHLTWTRAVLPHVAGAIGFGLADVLIERGISLLVALPEANADLITLFLRRLFPNSLCYLAVVGIAGMVRQSRISLEREAAANRLASQLTEARMQALQAQLRPHFLFNTLSMIAEQVHVDPGSADLMIGRLGHLLRVSLASTDRQEVTVEDELATLESYLDIMAVRLAGRATFEVQIDPQCRNALVPTLILQPLAENAYRHGIERLSRAGLLTVHVLRDGDSLEIAIANNGAGVDTKHIKEGIGLRIVRERLAQMYGPGGSLTLKPGAQGGSVSTIRLPFRRLAELNSDGGHAALNGAHA